MCDKGIQCNCTLDPKQSAKTFIQNTLCIMNSNPQRGILKIRKFIDNCSRGGTIKVKHKNRENITEQQVIRINSINYRKVYINIFEAILKQTNKKYKLV